MPAVFSFPELDTSFTPGFLDALPESGYGVNRFRRHSPHICMDTVGQLIACFLGVGHRISLSARPVSEPPQRKVL